MSWIKRSLFAKLLAGLLLAVVIPFVLSNIVAYRTAVNSVRNEYIASNQNVMGIGMEAIKRYLDELSLLTVSYYRDDTLMRYLNDPRALAAESLYITDQMENIYSSRPEIRAFRFESALTGNVYTFQDLSFNFYSFDAQSASAGERPLKQTFEVMTANQERVLVVRKPLQDIPAPRILGWTSLYVGPNVLDNIITSLFEPDRPVSLFIGDDMALLYTTPSVFPGVSPEDLPLPRGLAPGPGHLNGGANDSPGVIAYFKDYYKDLPLALVTFIPDATINKAANQALRSTVLIQLAVLPFLAAFALLITYVVVVPVKRLLRMIADVETGRFELEPASGRTDELGVLERRFRSMARRLGDLINKDLRLRLEIADARLKMLQAQIHPHFLYNTLQYIGTMALRRGMPEVSEKIGELGAIFRYNMDMRTDMVPLRLELQHIRHYLSLHAGRFGDRLAYEIRYPEEAAVLFVPKMMLQPLVENCITHGMEEGKGRIFVRVEIALEGKRLIVRVVDDGKGMDEETIRRIRADFEADRFGPSGIGLLNVMQRLRLMYGGEFAWRIESDPYRSTAVHLEIPIPEDGEGEGAPDESAHR